MQGVAILPETCALGVAFVQNMHRVHSESCIIGHGGCCSVYYKRNPGHGREYVQEVHPL
jgi:hypothetical protein